MPKLFGREYTREEIMRRVGDISQVAGIRSFTLDNGWARGVRVVQVRTGSGLTYDILLDRGADVGLCELNGRSVAWMPPMRFPGPWFYELRDDGWLRTGLGGLLNTAGLTHIGTETDDEIQEYRRPGDSTEHFGVHGRVSHIPAELVSSSEDWQGDECELTVIARVRQASSYGENLVMTRQFRSLVGESRIRLRDVIVNEGFNRTYFAMLYHFNAGFPLLDGGARMLLPSPQFLGALFSPSAGDPAFFDYPNPEPEHHLQSAEFRLGADDDGRVTVALINEAIEPALALSLTYERERLPIFHTARAVGEGLYFVGIEPCTNQFGRQSQKAQGLLRQLRPGESVVHEIDIEVHEGPEAVEAIRRRVGSIGAEQR